MRDRPRPEDETPGPAAPETPAGAGVSPAATAVDGNVVALGFTSFFSDISSEMVNSVLPLYLTTQMGFSPLQFGLFDGAYQGMSGVLRLGGGLLADRRGRHKEVAGAGYAISAVAKIGLMAAPGGAATSAVLLADRTGKGIRTAPRDALISLSSPPGRMAESFGVHRALDTAGACIGPVLAFVMLSTGRGDYQPVFLASFCAALIGLSVLALFVRNRARPAGAAAVPGNTRGTPPTPGSPVSWREAVGLLRVRSFRRMTVGGVLLALVGVSDAFAYWVLARRVDLPDSPFPLLFVGTALAYLLLAVPFGRLADRIGRSRVFIAGHVVLVGAFALLRFGPAGTPLIFAFLGLLGAYYAATDGVLMAMVTESVPEQLRASGMAILTTLTTFARFAASATFGLLWVWRGPISALSAFLVALVVTLPFAARLIRPQRAAGLSDV